MTKRIKTGGRIKGTPNKLTKELRSVLKNIICKELELLDQQLDKLEPKQRVEIVIKLMPYVFPKLNSISYTSNEPLDWGFE